MNFDPSVRVAPYTPPTSEHSWAEYVRCLSL